jgi:hypothetical protein
MSKVDLMKAQQLLSDKSLDSLPIEIPPQITRDPPHQSSSRLLAIDPKLDDFPNTWKQILTLASENPSNMYKQEMQLLEAIKGTRISRNGAAARSWADHTRFSGPAYHATRASTGG